MAWRKNGLKLLAGFLLTQLMGQACGLVKSKEAANTANGGEDAAIFGGLGSAPVVSLNPFRYSEASVVWMQKIASSVTPSNPQILSAQKVHAGSELSDLHDQQNWLADYRFELPTQIPVTTGQSGSHWSTFTFQKTDQAIPTVCVYKGTGSINKSNPGCGQINGTQYQFSYCIDQNTFEKLNCSSNINNCNGQPEILPIAGGDMVTANEVDLYIAHGDSCASKTAIQMTLNNLSAVSLKESGGSVKRGQVVAGDNEIPESLDCSNHDGPALIFVGNDSDFDGGGRTITVNSKSQIGILLTGSGNILKNFKVVGTPTTIGILAYNAPDSTLEGNTVTQSMLGIDYYADRGDMKEIQINNNVLTDNDLFGLRVIAVEDAKIEKPTITGNDFSRTSQFALRVHAEEFEMKGNANNLFFDSGHGIFVSGRMKDEKLGGKVDIEDLDLSTSRIKGQAIYADGLKEFKLEDSKLSTGQGNYQIGLHLYNVEKTELEKLTIQNTNIGIKTNIDQDIEATLKVEKSVITGSRSAGMMIQAEKGSSYKEVKVEESDLTNNPAGYAIWVVAGTELKKSIKLDKNKQ